MKCPKCGREMIPKKSDMVVEDGLTEEEVWLAKHNRATYFLCINCKGQSINECGNTPYLLVDSKLYEHIDKLGWMPFSGREKVIFT